ncbi:hypothetical protein EYF80_061981 [Liparis tanakae]|uniref:Uncharacterized protein n=1 Tax=Liparis tanakae TaxID=230148 RepID=A0A4Z2EHQ7_9TELE|nr:hypothetical protein EYF80_061981 [Liparis tanakae]
MSPGCICCPCLACLFMGPRYEPSVQRPFPVLLGSPHQPHSGCSRHWEHVRRPEQFWAGGETEGGALEAI